MKEQLITFETAKLAKEKGFEGYTIWGYILDTNDGEILVDDEWEEIMEDNPDIFEFIGYAPTQSLLQKWLREKHMLHCSSECNASGWMWVIEKSNGTFIKDSGYSGDIPESGMWKTYEEALEEGLKQGLKLIK
jgi:hypothetical protein